MTTETRVGIVAGLMIVVAARLFFTAAVLATTALAPRRCSQCSCRRFPAAD
jgi:hypothetical protein